VVLLAQQQNTVPMNGAVEKVQMKPVLTVLTTIAIALNARAGMSDEGRLRGVGSLLFHLLTNSGCPGGEYAYGIKDKKPGHSDHKGIRVNTVDKGSMIALAQMAGNDDCYHIWIRPPTGVSVDDVFRKVQTYCNHVVGRKTFRETDVNKKQHSQEKAVSREGVDEQGSSEMMAQTFAVDPLAPIRQMAIAFTEAGKTASETGPKLQAARSEESRLESEISALQTRLEAKRSERRELEDRLADANLTLEDEKHQRAGALLREIESFTQPAQQAAA
jgi:hypothetical protein